MDQLLQEIENLKVQQELFENEREKATEESSVKAFDAEIDVVKSKIAEKQLQIEQMKQKENEIVATVTSGESSFGISCGGYTADFRALASGEDEYQMLSITTQLYLAQLESEHERSLKALEDSYEAEKASNKDKIDALEEEIYQTRQDLSDVRGKLEAASNKIADIEIERDSAVKEAEQLRKQLEDLRQQITEKPKIATNLNGENELAAIKERIEAKKIPVYNVRPGDNRTSFYIANLATTGEEVEIRPYYELKSKYREVSENEVSQFRAQEEINQALLESASTVSEKVEVPQLQFQEPTVPEYVLHGESATEDAGSPETIEEVVAKLTKRVERLEIQAGIGI